MPTSTSSGTAVRGRSRPPALAASMRVPRSIESAGVDGQDGGASGRRRRPRRDAARPPVVSVVERSGDPVEVDGRSPAGTSTSTSSPVSVGWKSMIVGLVGGMRVGRQPGEQRQTTSASASDGAHGAVAPGLAHWRSPRNRCGLDGDVGVGELLEERRPDARSSASGPSSGPRRRSRRCCRRRRCRAGAMLSPSSRSTSVMWVIRRAPSLNRAWCTIRSTAAATCSRTARIGRSMPAISTIVSRRESVSRGAVGVQGADRAVVAGVHRLQHVERGGVADLADDDPVRAHAQAVAHQVADRDLAPALDVGRARLEADDVLLVQLQLGGVLDGDDPLVVGDERRQHVERGRLAGAGAAGDDDVEPTAHARLEEVGGLRGQRADVDEVVDGEHVGGELADGQGRAVDGQRRDHGVDRGCRRAAGRRPSGSTRRPGARCARRSCR